MNREEDLKRQEERVRKLFPPEYCRAIAECTHKMLDNAYNEMERQFGKDWREKASQTLVNPNADGNYIGVSRNGIEMRCDPKTAFLDELHSLLKEYDAEIIAHIGEDDNTHADKPMMYIQIGDEVVNYDNGLDHCEITPENIFNYEKE